MENNGKTYQREIALDKRNSRFRISATKNEVGELESIDMECRINAEEKEARNEFDYSNETAPRSCQASSFNISAKKDAAGDFSSVEMDCCINSENGDADEKPSSVGNLQSKCWMTVLCDVFTEAWVQWRDQVSNLIAAVLVTIGIFVLQYYDVVSVSFSGLECDAISICTSIAGLVFAALALTLPLAKYLRVGNVDYYKSLAGIFSYTVLINLFTVVWALVMSWITVNGYSSCNVPDYMLMFLLIYSIVLACSATLHCFCVHTFIDPKK